jgi:hypothetical protein
LNRLIVDGLKRLNDGSWEVVDGIRYPVSGIRWLGAGSAQSLELGAESADC